MKNKAQKNLWRKRLYVSLLLSGLTAMTVLPMASAEEVSEVEAAPAVEASTEEGDTPEIVVSATRTEMAVKDAPASVTIITRRELEQKNANNLVDALREVPGVDMRPSGSMAMDDQVRIRGSYGNHVLLLIDGKRVTGENSSQNARELERLRMDNVERVEVIKGAGATLYGSDAIGGVINVITRKSEKDSIEVYADYRTLEGTGEASGDYKNNIGMFVQGKKRGSFRWTLNAGRNYINKVAPYTSYRTANSYGEAWPINFKGIWDINENQSLTLDLGFLKESLTSGTAGTAATAFRDYDSTWDSKRYDWAIDWSGKKNQADWMLRYYASRYDKDYATPFIDGSGNMTDPDWAENSSDVLEGRLSYTLSDKHLLTAGFETSYKTVEGSRLADEGKNEDSYSLYVQNEWMPSKKWLVIPGGRFDKVGDFKEQFTPSLGATYFYQPGLRFKATIAQGYRAPSMSQRYNDWIMGGMIWQRGNPDLKPEKSTNYEIGVEKDWKNNSVSLRYYRSEIKDLIHSEIEMGVGPTGMATLSTNLDEAVMQGVELSGKHKISKEFNLRAGYNYLDARDRSNDDRLSGRARHQVTVGFDYTPVNSPWSFNVDGSILLNYLYKTTNMMTGAITAYDKNDYPIVNATVKRKVGNGSIYFGVENLLDREDYDVRGHYGRTYLMGVNYKF